MQIRYNLSHLEQWTRDMRLHESGVTDTLAPIIQAAQLLQARKTDDDVHSICDMCDKLTVSQVSNLLWDKDIRYLKTRERGLAYQIHIFLC